MVMSRDLRIASLDGPRGITASAVVYAHINFSYPSANPWIHLATGDEAAAIFLSLSGFLMALLCPNKPMNGRDYPVHRFARIYPVYLVSVLFVVALSLVYADQRKAPVAAE
jgi:peptidoglycan/LPS O-acetylase OafA/YrhL